MDTKILTLEDILRKSSEKNQDIVVQGEHYRYNGHPVQKEFYWAVVLSMLMKRGFKLRVHYSRNDVRDKPSKFSMDAENGIAPIMPLRVEVLKQEVVQVNDELSQVLGSRMDVITTKVMDLENIRGLDPDPDTSMNLFDMLV